MTWPAQCTYRPPTDRSRPVVSEEPYRFIVQPARGRGEVGCAYAGSRPLEPDAAWVEQSPWRVVWETELSGWAEPPVESSPSARMAARLLDRLGRTSLQLPATMSRRLSHRKIAQLLSLDAAQQGNLQTDLTGSCRVRNKIIHGDVYTEAEVQQAIEASSETLRSSLLALL